MGCKDCKDNRVNCSEKITTTCIDYTGKVSPLIKDKLPCNPNANDVLEEIQTLIESIKTKLGDNTLLFKRCLTYDEKTVTQYQLNQLFNDEICALKAAVSNLDDPINASTFMITIDLLCAANENCDIPTSYSLLTILQNILLKLCDHETRIQSIETFLNL